MTSLLLIALLLTAAALSVLTAAAQHWYEHRNDERTAVYEWFHRYRPGRIYIGVTNDPAARQRRHARESTWWANAADPPRVTWCRSRAAAYHLERRLIREAWAAGEPIENRAHVPGRSRRRAVRY